MSANLLPVQGVKAITYIATCPDKQVVLSLLCSLLNTVRFYVSCNWASEGHTDRSADPEVQSGKLESAIQSCCVQGSKANPCYIRPPIPSCGFSLSHTRNRPHQNAEELLSPFVSCSTIYVLSTGWFFVALDDCIDLKTSNSLLMVWQESLINQCRPILHTFQEPRHRQNACQR